MTITTEAPGEARDALPQGAAWTVRVRALLSRRADRVWDPPAWVAALAVLAVLAVHAAVAWGNVMPHFAADEVGMIGNSLVIGRGEAPWSLVGGSYAPGLAVLIAPAWWFTDDPIVVFKAAMTINVALAVLAVWPLSRVAVRAGIGPRAAVVAASAVMVAPAMTLSSNYVVAEHLVVAATALTVVTAFRLVERRGWWEVAAFGGAVGAVTLSHGRGLAIGAAAFVWAILLVRSLGMRALAAACAVAVASVGAYAVMRLVTAELYIADNRTSGTLDNITNIDLGRMTAVAIGQAWYVALAWPAVAVIGIAWLVRRPQPMSGRGFVVLAGLAAGALSLTQSVDLPHTPPRLDVWVYGRYFDHIAVVCAVIGLALLLRVRWAGLAAAVIATTALLASAFMVLTVPRVPVGGWWVDLHIAGIAPFLNLENVYNGTPEAWGWLSLASVGFAAIVVAAAWIPGLPVVVLVLLWVMSGLGHDSGSLDVRGQGTNDMGRDPYHVGDLPADAQVAFVVGTGLDANLITFLAHPREIARAAIDEATGYDAVIASFSDRRLADLGGRRYVPVANAMTTVWIMPGDIAAELDTQGLLVDEEQFAD